MFIFLSLFLFLFSFRSKQLSSEAIKFGGSMVGVNVTPEEVRFIVKKHPAQVSLYYMVTACVAMCVLVS